MLKGMIERDFKAISVTPEYSAFHFSQKEQRNILSKIIFQLLLSADSSLNRTGTRTTLCAAVSQRVYLANHHSISSAQVFINFTLV